MMNETPTDAQLEDKFRLTRRNFPSILYWPFGEAFKRDEEEWLCVGKNCVAAGISPEAARESWELVASGAITRFTSL